MRVGNVFNNQSLPPVEFTNGKTCSNLTQVLDNWKFAIITQVKDLLVHDHASVLPEYNRIRPLSDAVGDLYRQFNTLKDDLAKLTSKFDGVEAFVDDLKHGRVSVRQRPAQRLLPDVGLRSPLRAQMRSPVRGIMKRPALITRRRALRNAVKKVYDINVSLLTYKLS
ncbi:hypothetical protein D4764_0015560 [Takifugu flavidus]|uniref:Uncharacterized protein n=1 Tax=Takifugu flavidus TaxID=433684 RepID=A0A5C6MND9_9TELE|nr:hypothetical protein D4764_0015560 [Takifugu flavidus]